MAHEVADLKPKEHGLPKWVQQRVNEAIKDGRMDDPGYVPVDGSTAMNHAVDCLGRKWADHWGHFTDDDGTEVLVSEPYADKVTQKALAQLEHFCEVLDLEYVLEASSQHYPGQTLRILVWPKAK
jgi:hypothetical protein